MKKTLLIIFGAAGILCSTMANSQTFTLEKDTARGIVLNNSYAEIHNKVINTSPGSVQVSWKVTSISLPSAWTINGFGICDNQLCLNYFNATQFALKVADPLASNENFDYKLAIDVSALPWGGPYYVTTNMTDGTTTKNPVFEIYKGFPTNVPTVNKSKEDVVMYPNPAHNELNIVYNGSSNIKNIAVYNLIGKAVNVYKVTSDNNANLDISSIPSGIYFVRLLDAQGRVVATRKFTHQ
jgi:hypothetical protein